MAYYNPRLIGGALSGGPIAKTGLATFLAILLSLGCIGLAVGFMLGGDVVDQIKQATVWIKVDGGETQGSGVIIREDGYILTAAHVIKNGQAQSIEVVLNSGEKNAETVRGTETEQIGHAGTPTPEGMGKDYALIKVESARPLPFLQVVGSEDVTEGTKCFLAGFPAGSEMQTSIYGPNVRIDPGTITAIMRGGDQGAMAFNTDVSVREGMSGGPCTDEKGRVIGLALMYSEKAAANLVLPTSRFKHVWEPLARAQ
jgi:S1-C subfamily serine protease